MLVLVFGSKPHRNRFETRTETDPKTRPSRLRVQCSFCVRDKAADAGGAPNPHFRLDLAKLLIQLPPDPRPPSSLARLGSQPIALTGAALLLIIAGVASIALWRVYTGYTPETDRAAAVRALQARAAQASE